MVEPNTCVEGGYAACSTCTSTEAEEVKWMSDTTYRAGIVGLGFIGAGDQVSGDVLGQQVKDLDGTHLDALAGHPRVELVAGSSRDPGRRERFSQRTGANVYADWREMLAREALDIVSVATYAPTHAEISISCVEHGARVVYCEKPIATRPADAERALKACEANGALLVVNHNRRFNPNGHRLREAIARGDLGDLTSISLQWSTGRLANIGTHIFDATCMLTGRQIQAVSGALDLSGRPDCRGPQFHDYGGWGLLRLDGGLIATVDAADHSRLPFQIALNGTEGRALTAGDEVTIEYWDGRQEHLPTQLGQTSSMDRAVAGMIEWLDRGTPFPYMAADAAAVLEAIAAFHISHDRNGAWVELPLQGADRDREVRCA